MKRSEKNTVLQHDGCEHASQAGICACSSKPRADPHWQCRTVGHDELRDEIHVVVAAVAQRRLRFASLLVFVQLGKTDNTRDQ